MKKLILASNKLPINSQFIDGNFNVSISVDTKFTGLRKFYSLYETTWVGLTGIDDHIFSDSEISNLENKLNGLNCIPIFPHMDDYQRYLHGFSRNTLWPLFHYFTQNVVYHDEDWESYKTVNRLFAEKIAPMLGDDDILWIHDFHLLLLPSMIREIKPNISIGLFVHVPFPSFEIFRLLPWRQEIIEGMLGADLIGFHIFDYVRHFLSSVRRLMGYDTIFNRITIGERTMKVDVFPRGIHYDLFKSEVIRLKNQDGKNKTPMQKQIERHLVSESQKKLILSIDPLDYTKGIPTRLKAFEIFLQRHPEYIEKVSLLLLALPSGESGRSYFEIKRQADELVGRINGYYGTITWTPIIYMNQEFTIDELIGLYAYSDIALILPLRDGLNLAAKEYVASRIDGRGVLILSELAGTSKELHEAILVNPNNLPDIADAIQEALEMPEEEQVRRNEVMNGRLKRYPIERWANEFIQNLEGVKEIQKTTLTRKINDERIDSILKSYRKADSRILFLDYDGTLAWFRKTPEEASPDPELCTILEKLSSDSRNKVVIISGRDKETLGRWFPDSWPIHFVAEHGVWLRDPGSDWYMMEQIDNSWKESVYHLLDYYVDQTPKTFIESKNFSLVWHYRKADPDLGIQRSWELKEQLRNLTANLNLEIMDGDKVIEIKYSGINKGRAALNKLGNDKPGFIFAIGDDWTDEYTFDAMPAEAITIKVGSKSTRAAFYIDSVDSVRKLLSRMNGK